MAKLHPHLTEEIQAFIAAQPLFFVASAPDAGRINLSPKGGDTLRVLAPDRVAYLDYTGSRAETGAHLRQNGRLTLMFCAFTGDALILRLYGTGRAVLPGVPEWAELAPRFPASPGTRQIILLEVDTVQTSCGQGVPYMDYRGERDGLPRWFEKKGPEGLRQYRLEKNSLSLDGLPTGLFPTPPETTS